MKTQFMILTAGLILAGFIGCYEDSKRPIQIQSSPTDVKMEGLDTLSHDDIKDLLDSLSAIEIMPIGTMN
jgi:hypothetical protein